MQFEEISTLLKKWLGATLSVVSSTYPGVSNPEARTMYWGVKKLTYSKSEVLLDDICVTRRATLVIR